MPLSAYVAMPATVLDGFGIDRLAVLAVAVPLLLVAGVATHVTIRQSLARSSADGGGPAAALLRWMPWLAPIGGIVAGLFFPLSIGVLLYWLTSNTWTLLQQHVGGRWVDRRVPEPAPAAVAAPAAAPRPGAVGDPVRRRGRSRTGRRRARR